MKILKMALQLGILGLIAAVTLAPVTASAGMDPHHRHHHHMVKRIVWRHGHKHVIWVKV